MRCTDSVIHEEAWLACAGNQIGFCGKDETIFGITRETGVIAGASKAPRVASSVCLRWHDACILGRIVDFWG